MAPGEGVETQPNQLCCGEGGKERPAAARPCAGRDLGDTAAPGSRRSLKTRGARRQSWCSLLFDSCKAPVVRQRNHQSKRERWIPPPISQGTICTLFSFSKHSGFTDRSGFIVYTSGWRNWVHMSLSFLMLKKTHTIYFWRSGKTSKFHLGCTPTAAILFDGEHVLLKIQPDTQNVTSLRPDYKWTQQMGQTSSQSPGPQQQPLLYRVKKLRLSRVRWIPGLNPAAGDLPLTWQPWAHRINTAIPEGHHCHTRVTNASVQAHSFYKASICQQKKWTQLHLQYKTASTC